MFTRSEAEENLRTIRSLMERSTIYRAISAPTALTGGLLSIIACGSFYFRFHGPEFKEVDPALLPWFLCPWFTTLILTVAANTVFIWRGAKQRSEPFFSAGMKLAFVSLLPGMLCAAFFTAAFLLFARIFPFLAFFLPALWMIFYGLGLLSTSHFAPRSITWLGWVFLISGFAGCAYLPYCCNFDTARFFFTSNFLMGATFGLYHLIYAACTWPRKSTEVISGYEP